MVGNVKSGSVFTAAFPDERARTVDVLGLDEWADITVPLQTAIDSLKSEERFGIVLLPEGNYTISDTVYIPKAIRLIGYGKKRPVLRLADNCPGYSEPDMSDKGEARYMIWFTNNMPRIAGRIDDSNPGTFYSAVMNIDFDLGEGNPYAVAIRAHYAQNCCVSCCRFDIRSGKAGIFDVGNEMNNLEFVGGQYGIYTTKCSPGWPFALVDSAFSGQRESSIYSRECGLTIVSCSFADAPHVLVTQEEYWEKAYFENCIFDNIPDCAIVSRFDRSVCTQTNIRNVYCRNVPKLYCGCESYVVITAPSPIYAVDSLTAGECRQSGEPGERKTEFETRSIDKLPKITPVTPECPGMEKWRSVRDFGAIGDGAADDTAALQRAIDECECVYLPQGSYRVTDTVRLRSNTKLIALQPASTCIMITDDTPAFSGFGAPVPVLHAPCGEDIIISSLAIDSGGRNTRACACLWEGSGNSFMYDIKFVGGHGRMSADSEFLPPYNKSRTADFDDNRPWDCQYPSLVVRGGGTLMNIWSASPYAEAGVLIENTCEPGRFIQLSVEHHVRNEIIMRNVSNWRFLAIQTEEEKAESGYCLPYELSGCRDLLFANLYSFRVIWVETVAPLVMKLSSCDALEFLNVHNYTQMKHTIETFCADLEGYERCGGWQMARYIYTAPDTIRFGGEYDTIATGFDCVDLICGDSQGTVYVCDSLLKKIYRIREGAIDLYASLHDRPVAMVCDKNDRLVAVMEYRLLPGESIEQPFEREVITGARSSYYEYFSFIKRIKAAVIGPELTEIEPVPFEPKAYETLYMPHNQWCDAGRMDLAFRRPEMCFPLGDGDGAIAFMPGISRTVQLEPTKRGECALCVDEYNKCVWEYTMSDSFEPEDMHIIANAGEYSACRHADGRLFVCDEYICETDPDTIISPGDRGRITELPHRPAGLLLLGDTLYVTARREIYTIDIRRENKNEIQTACSRHGRHFAHGHKGAFRGKRARNKGSRRQGSYLYTRHRKSSGRP